MAKTYVKKKEALALIETRTWERRGTLVKEPGQVSVEEIFDALAMGWRIYRVPGRFVCCSTQNHDVFYESAD